MPLLQKYKLNITWGDQDLLNIIFHYNPGMFSHVFRPVYVAVVFCLNVHPNLLTCLLTINCVSCVVLYSLSDTADYLFPNYCNQMYALGGKNMMQLSSGSAGIACQIRTDV